MKILAVIPARAGSKGIPNKNIRIVGGHPLVYYAIRNALESKLITDIVVSTDSPEVRIVAMQMGAAVRWRDAALCGDGVTLDSVVYDAIPSGSWDYIVTMQPTSPTLSVESLDKAIRSAINRGLDTLISAINAPHLSWKEEGGRKVPAYEKRLNRQYLPANYLETGAFVISRASAVTPQSRIGAKVDVYELPPEEALDIDGFADLKAAEMILERQKVAIYIGDGHRALELADEFFTKPDLYYDVNRTDPAEFGTTTHNLIPFDGTADLFEKCRRKQYTVFINDSPSCMTGLRPALPGARIINLDDNERYYICSKAFLFYKPITIKEKVERVFICFGDSAPRNYADRFMQIISAPEYAAYSFTVVPGRARHDRPDMPGLMAACDIGITSQRDTGYELAILGIPTIDVFSYTGPNPADEVIKSTLDTYLHMSAAERLHLQQVLLSRDLRNGRRRVMELINSI